jgi:hypothetical protein
LMLEHRLPIRPDFLEFHCRSKLTLSFIKANSQTHPPNLCVYEECKMPTRVTGLGTRWTRD